MCRQHLPDFGCIGSVRRTAAAVMTCLACLSLCIPAPETAGRHDTGACREGTVNLASRAAGGHVWALREQARDDLVAVHFAKTPRGRKVLEVFTKERVQKIEQKNKALLFLDAGDKKKAGQRLKHRLSHSFSL